MKNKEAIKVLQRYLIQSGEVLPKFGVDGDLGSETKNAIDALDYPEYVKAALKEVGVKEIVGAKHNPRVLEYQATTAGKYKDDETPWCGAFISWVMKEANIDHNIKVTERAKEWKRFGVDSVKPVLGAIAIKSRIGGGHVCIVVGKLKNGNLLCVGGNQNNEVNITQYSPSVFEDYRLPISTNSVQELKIYDLQTKSVLSEA